MVANVALEPSEIMSDVIDRSRRVPGTPAPRLLGGSITPPDPLSPIRQETAIVEMHQRWANQSAAVTTPAPSAGPTTTVRLRALLKGAVNRTRLSVRGDPELTASLIRAVDALAVRSDEMAERLHQLQSLVEEVVLVVSEDLVQIRATLEASGGPASDGPASGEPATGGPAPNEQAGRHVDPPIDG